MMIERWRPTWALRPWRPFRELEDVERLFDHMFGRTFLPGAWRQLAGDGWTPTIELLEKEDKSTGYGCLHWGTQLVWCEFRRYIFQLRIQQ